MKPNLFKVVFTGQINNTLSINIIRKNLLKLLNRNHKKVESFFNKKPFVIKKNIDQITAERYKNTLKKAGVVCIIKPEDKKQETTTQASDNLKNISTKSTCKIIKLNIRRIDFRLNPLSCNLITSTPEGIKLHRPEKEAAKFSEIRSVSICSKTGDTNDIHIILFIKGLIRPVSVRPVNIRFSDFCDTTAVSITDSIKQFINYLCNKNSALIMDKNTYKFISNNGGQVPKEDPNRLSTAMSAALNPAKKKVADSTKAPFSENQGFNEKMDNESSELAYSGHSQNQKESAKDLTAKRTRVKAISAGFNKKKLASMGRILLGIILIASGCLWIEANLNDAKKIDISAQNTSYSIRVRISAQNALLTYAEVLEKMYADNPWMLKEALKNSLMENLLTSQSYREIRQKLRSKIDAINMRARDQKQKLKPGCRFAVFILYVGFWIFFSGFGKLGAIKSYKNQFKKDPGIFDADTDKLFLSVKLICAGILALISSAIMVSFSVDVMIENLGEAYLVKASGGAFLLLLSAFLIYIGYKLIRPTINLLYTHASRKHQIDLSRRDPVVNNYVEPIHDPIKVNLSGLLRPKYILIGIIALVTVLVSSYYYQSSKASKEYLRYNQIQLEKIRTKFDTIRMEIFRENLFVSDNVIETLHGDCSFATKDELIARLDADDIEKTNNITACFARFKDPTIIEPFLKWYQRQLDTNKSFSTRAMGDIIIAMKSKSVDPLSSALKNLENEKATDLAAKLLATINTEESIWIIANTIMEDSIPATRSAGKILVMVCSSHYIKIDKGFELVSRVYSYDDPQLRKIAIEALHMFEGTAARSLAMRASKDQSPDVANYAKKLLDLLN